MKYKKQAYLLKTKKIQKSFDVTQNHTLTFSRSRCCRRRYFSNVTRNDIPPFNYINVNHCQYTYGRS